MQKPQLSFGQIWNMCFGFFGIQVGFGLQNANVSRIFQTLGAEVDAIPILWVAAPLTGLLVQPIIGHMSDRTWARIGAPFGGGYGRRRPYFFYGALATTAALIFMPNSPALWVAAILLWVMDASINVTMEPFRAFVGDMLAHRQRTQGFATQSFFIGLGAVLASAMPWILSNWFGVSNSAPAGVIPPSVKFSFYIGGAFVLFSVMWTVFTTKEYSAEELAAHERAENGEGGREGEGAGGASGPSASALFRFGGAWLIICGVTTVMISQLALQKELFILSIGGAVFGLMQIGAGILRHKGKTENAFSEILDDLFLMPATMKQLAIVQFFSWFALFSMWIYTTAAVTERHFGTTDPTSAAYNEGANWVGVLFAIYNGVAAIAAFAIPPVTARIGRNRGHALFLLCGAAGFISLFLISDPSLLWASMIGVGIAWASILSVPYAILSGALPARKMGVYMGIFNFFIVVPQLTAASVLGVFVHAVFDDKAAFALLLGGASLVIAACASWFVSDKVENQRGSKAAKSSVGK